MISLFFAFFLRSSRDIYHGSYILWFTRVEEEEACWRVFGALSAPEHTCPGWLFCFLCFNLLWSVVFVALSILSLSVYLSNGGGHPCWAGTDQLCSQ